MTGLGRGLGIAALLAHAACAHAANGTVGTGTPASCTESAFNNTLFNVQVTGGGTITFNCGSAPLVIVMTGVKNISVPTTFQGGGRVTLSGGNATSLFQVLASGVLTLNDIVLTRAFGSYGAIENSGTVTMTGGRIERSTARVSGGAILNHATLRITDVTFADNTASDYGGAVHSDSASTFIDGSRFLNNSAGLGGGAVSNVGAPTGVSISTSLLEGNKSTLGRGGAVRVGGGGVSLIDSTVRLNEADLGGGVYMGAGEAVLVRTQVISNHAHYGAGIRQEGGSLETYDVSLLYNGSPFLSAPGAPNAFGGGAFSIGAGSASFLRTTIVSNEALNGGAVHQVATSASSPTTTFTNATMSGNQATEGGAIYIRSGSMTVTHGTIADNQASQGAGVSNGGGGLTLQNTALINPLGKNCTNAVTRGTFNASSDASCSLGGGRDNATLAFEAFANNGGYTLTRLPVAGSAAIDNAGGTACTSTDQRGAARPAGAACDIGATEYLPGAPPVASAIEYFHRDFGHYFVSNGMDEIVKLDLGLFSGWLRTGLRFNVFTLSPQIAPVDTTPVCRFFTTAFPPTSSHFYAPRGLGCEATTSNRDWTYEGDVFAVHLPDGTGKCPSGEAPVYRLYNNGQGGAPNHRYTTDATVRQQMLAAGYIAEGAGIGVGMCSPP